MIYRVLSYNIHKGFNVTNTKFVLEQIKEGIRRSNADLLLLQEVVGNAESGAVSNLPSQFEYLADGVWPHFAYGKNAAYEAGHHGNAILSRYPIESWNNLNISTNRWESRGLLHAGIQVEDKIIDAFSLHLNLFEGGRRLQSASVCRYIQEKTSANNPVVLGGDFNDWRKRISSSLIEGLGMKEVYQVLHGEYARTFPNLFPILPLDRIYYRGFKARHASVLTDSFWKKLSDHLPLYAEFEIV